MPYFTNNALRMDYAAYRKAGYQIGSGTVESACKQLGIQRMKVPGPPGTCKMHAYQPKLAPPRSASSGMAWRSGANTSPG